MSSFLESVPGRDVTLPAILQTLPGCRPLFEGRYREVIEEVAPTLSIMEPAKYAQVAASFADGRRRREQFVGYMLTEHCGGVFIDHMLEIHAGHPAQALLQRHARDERVHGELFGELAGTSVAEHERSDAYALEARYHEAYARWVGADFFSLACLLHGFELRSAVLQCYWFALMDMFPASEAAALRPTFTRISTDEVFHITYTARLVAEGLARGEPGEMLATALRLAEAPIEALEA